MPVRTTLFRSDHSQAVGLPEAVAFPDKVEKVTNLVDGPRRIIVPADAGWDAFFDSPGVDLWPRHQPEIEIRQKF
jgi:antitoxin VapB